MGVWLSKIHFLNDGNKNSRRSIISKSKIFSWEKRIENGISPTDFIMANITNALLYRKPGSVNGEQFIIESCSGCSIFLLDYTNTVIIDDCHHCALILGPVQRRNCSDCTIVLACDQFRLRDCKNLQVSLYCATKPTIESCKEITFGSFQLNYEHVQDHFQNSKLNIWNNRWYLIHDYTPGNEMDYQNWKLGNVDLLAVSVPQEMSMYNISLKKEDSYVPVSQGSIHFFPVYQENCLVVFCDDFSAMSFLKVLLHLEVGIVLIRSAQIEMKPHQAESMFFTSSFLNAIQHSPMIGLHLYGKQVIQICSQIISNTAVTSLYYVSPTVNIASHQVNTFFNVAELSN